MFGFFKRKENKNKCWSSTMEFINDLRRVPGSEMVNRASFDQNFEEFTHVLNQSSEWIKYECTYYPGTHDSRLDCYKYVTTVNQGGIPKILIEVSKQPVSDGTHVCFIDFEKVLKHTSSIFSRIKSMNLGENATLSIPVDEAIDALEILSGYDDLFPPLPGVSYDFKVYKDYSLGSIINDICFNVKMTKDHEQVFEGLFKVHGSGNRTSLTKISELPYGFDEHSNLYSRS